MEGGGQVYVCVYVCLYVCVWILEKRSDSQVERCVFGMLTADGNRFAFINNTACLSS